METKISKEEAMELIVPTKSIRNEYDFGSFKIADTETGILFHVKGGYDIFVQPRMASLYEHLRFLLDNYEEYKQWDENEREIFELTLNATVTNMEIPLFMASDQKSLFEIANVALSCLNELADEALNKPLQRETPEENGEFQRVLDAMDAASEQIEKDNVKE